MARFLNRADNAVDARACRNQQLISEIDGFSDDGHEGITVAGGGAADAIQKSEMHLHALQ